MPSKPTNPLSLTKFADRLVLPPVLRPARSRPGAYATLRIRMRSTRVRLHSELPLTEVWAYEGHVPGPTIEVRRGQRVQIEWINSIPADTPHPVTAVTAPDPDGGAPPDQIPQNRPGRSGGRINDALRRVPPWAVVHVHGGRIAAVYDGWTENGILSGQSLLFRYENDQRATLLWYHDHAMGITRFNVYAGLAGLYLIRDDEEDALGLPSGPYELPLLLQDRNLDTDAAGRLTGRLLHKVEEGTMEFFGPFTLVNGVIWPYADVEARRYRLRLLNGANARTFRLALLDEAGRSISDAIRQIGTDGGLLGAPVALPQDGLVLAPAERADLLVDFRAYRGQRLTLVNTAGAPFDGQPPTQPPGAPHPANRLADADVMEFRVAARVVDDPFALPVALSNSYRRLTSEEIPTHVVRRMVALVEENGMLLLYELAPALVGAAAPDEPLISVMDENSVTTPHRVVARHFEDTVNWFVAYGATEVWQFLNLTEDTHPMHVHLVQFQALRRDRYSTEGFDAASRRTAAPVTFAGHGALDANELGWKDTVRVNPGEMVTIAATFEGYTGRYMYHCHILEHEDYDMMRPFVVMPAAACEAMDMPEM
jgi:spore coat protein A